MKKITVLFTVLLMFAASTAMAAVTAEYPAAFNQTMSSVYAKENGTTLYFTGFGVNATGGSLSSGGDQAIIPFASNTTVTTFTNPVSESFYINSTLTALFNGTITGYNKTVSELYDFNATKMTLGLNNSTGDLTGLVTFGQRGIAQAGIAPFNSTSKQDAPFFFSAGNYQLLVGVANGTLGQKGIGKRNVGVSNVITCAGMSMPIIYQNGTFKDIHSSDTEWDYYAFGQQGNDPVMIFGSVKVTTLEGDANAAIKYYIYNGTDKTDKTDDWYTANATGLLGKGQGGNMALTGEDYYFMENGTINKDQNMITGFSYTHDQKELFAVMIKSGTVFDTNDIKNRGFNMVYVGAGYGDKTLGNATAGMFQFTADSSLGLTGNAKIWEDFVDGDGLALNGKNFSLDRMSSAVASTSQYGLAQSNMTIYGTDGTTVAGSFIGKQTADKIASVGFFEDADGYRALAFLMPSTAVTGATTSAALGYQFNSTATFAPVFFEKNSTAYTATELKAAWSGIDADFTPITNVKGYRVAVPAQKYDYYYSAQYQMTGVGGKIGDLRLYKLMADSTSAYQFSYSDTAAVGSDGTWWISTGEATGALTTEFVLDPADEYYVTWVVKDDGTYDANKTEDGINDPVVLGSVPTSLSLIHI